jgi:hypothetical protein
VTTGDFTELLQAELDKVEEEIREEVRAYVDAFLSAPTTPRIRELLELIRES